MDKRRLSCNKLFAYNIYIIIYIDIRKFQKAPMPLFDNFGNMIPSRERFPTLDISLSEVNQVSRYSILHI